MITQRLRHIAEVRVSNVDKKSVDGQIPVRLCNYTDVYYHDNITPALEYMEATATSDQVTKFRLVAGDVLMTKDSETPDDIGVPAVVIEAASDLLCGYHLALIRPQPQVLDGRYLKYALSAGPARAQMTSMASGITRYGLRSSSIGSLQIPVPPLRQQRVIADYLDRESARIDALIEKKQEMMALFELRLLRHIQDWTTDRGRPMHRLTRLVRTGSGTTPADLNGYYDGGVPWACSGDLRDGPIEETARTVSNQAVAENSALRYYEPGSVVIAMYGATIGKVGWLTERATTNQACCVFYEFSATLSPRYLWIWLLGARDRLIALGRGGTQPNISQEVLRSLAIPLPSITDQNRVIAAFEAYSRNTSELASRLATQIDLLKERRQALITAVVSGEMEVPTAA